MYKFYIIYNISNAISYIFRKLINTFQTIYLNLQKQLNWTVEFYMERILYIILFANTLLST